MDLKAHFESYRDSLKEDIFKECEEYAKQTPTADPARYPTVYSYLSMTLSHIKEAIAQGDLESYKRWLQHHQKAMLALLERMADEILWGQDTVNIDQYLALVNEKGWNWYKFCKRSIRLQLNIDGESIRVDIIPRYSESFQDTWKKPRLIFDANEMYTLNMNKGTGLSKQIMNLKKQSSGLKLIRMRGADPILRQIPNVNTPEVIYDWSLNLFGAA